MKKLILITLGIVAIQFASFAQDLPLALFEAISSKSLDNVKKVVDQKSLSELRAVLQSLNKDKKNDKVTPPKEEEKSVKKEAITKDKPKEIPEDKLRQMLHVDNRGN